MVLVEQREVRVANLRPHIKLLARHQRRDQLRFDGPLTRLQLPYPRRMPGRAERSIGRDGLDIGGVLPLACGLPQMVVVVAGQEAHSAEQLMLLEGQLEEAL